MVPEQCLFVFRLVIYIVLWTLSFFCFIPLSIVLDKHDGYCLLYADRNQYGAVAPCGYTISVPVIFSLIYGGYMVVAYCVKISIYNQRGYIQETLIEFLTTVVMDGLSWIFMFVSASLVSAGFNDMCWSIFGTIEKCTDGVLRHPVFGTDDNFFSLIKMAEVAMWLSWLFWLVQFLLGLMALLRSGICPERDSETCCSAFPCRPQCTCKCQLNFQKPDDQSAGIPLQQKKL